MEMYRMVVLFFKTTVQLEQVSTWWFYYRQDCICYLARCNNSHILIVWGWIWRWWSSGWGGGGGGYSGGGCHGGGGGSYNSLQPKELKGETQVISKVIITIVLLNVLRKTFLHSLLIIVFFHLSSKTQPHFRNKRHETSLGLRPGESVYMLNLLICISRIYLWRDERCSI